MRAFLRIAAVLTAILALVAAIVTLLTELVRYTNERNTPSGGNSETSKVFEVSATQDWQNTGINLKAGQDVSFSVESGSWTYTLGSEPYQNGDSQGGYICGAADCVEQLPSAPTGALIGKIGNEIFLVGSKANIMAPTDGFLFLRMNDGDVSDNDGTLVVQITTKD